jgi:DNA mismatch endonuclease (patch repair protein)
LHPSVSGLNFLEVKNPRRSAPEDQHRDRPTELTHSEVMSRVRSYGNKSTELRLIALLKQHRLSGWRRRYSVIGRPDFVFPKAHLAVFVDGCFWHGHPRLCRLPSTNRQYWLPKIRRNVRRDREVSRQLRLRGWHVVRIWEHDLKRDAARCVRRIKKYARTNVR